MHCMQGLLVLTAPPEDLPGMFMNAASIIEMHDLEEILKKRYGDKHEWHQALFGNQHSLRPGDWMEIQSPYTMDYDTPKVLGWLIGLGVKVG